MVDEVQSIMIYEYPSLDGLPVATVEMEGAALQAVVAMQAHGVTCEGMLAFPEDGDGVALVGMVWGYPSTYGPVHVLMRFGEDALWLQPREVAPLLKTGGTSFLKDHGDTPWMELWDVALWFQYEADYGLAFLVSMLADRFLPAAPQERAFRLGQCLFAAIERNYHGERQALRRALRKALPQLVPGTQIAKKKPGYGRGKGRAHFFLTQRDALLPTQLLTEPVSRAAVESLREAIQGYHSPRGYFFAPGLAGDVALDANMVLVPFGRQP
jgi:hypothetical protein